MRLIFMGSPQPVVAPLDVLRVQGPARGHDLLAVVSQPARPAGRRGVFVDPPVAVYAKQLGLKVLQPERASNPAFLDELRALAPDVIITAAYGQILSKEFLAIPKRGTINVHPSLLPRHRGATPVPAALMQGEHLSGVTILFTVQKLDAGNIIIQQEVPIKDHETAGELTQRYFALSGSLLLSALDRLLEPGFVGTPQAESAVSYCRKISKEDGLIDWQLPAQQILNNYRAFEPWPGSFAFFGGKRLALREFTIDANEASTHEPGSFTFDKNNRVLRVQTGKGMILIAKIKPAGGKEVEAGAFWNGLKDRSRLLFDAVESVI